MVQQRPGANVERLVRENETIARNQAMMKELHETQQVAAWHERQYQRTGLVTVGELQRRLRWSCGWRRRRGASREIRELVAADNLEAELNAMGLTVAKERH